MPARTLKHLRFRTAVRKTATWGGFTASVVLIAIWIYSGWGGYECSPFTSALYVSEGQALVGENLQSLLYNPFRSAVLPAQLYPSPWWFVFGRSGSAWLVGVPLWFPALVTLFVSSFAWRADWAQRRWVRDGSCAACGYDRAGLPASGRCPECGMGGDVQNGAGG